MKRKTTHHKNIGSFLEGKITRLSAGIALGIFTFLFNANTLKAQWTDLNAPQLTSPDAYNYNRLAVSDNGKNIIAHATKLILSPFSMDGKYIISSNYGATWNEYAAPSTVPEQFFWEGDNLYIKEDTVLKKSTDFGVSYTIQNNTHFPSTMAAHVLRTTTGEWLNIKSTPAWRLYSSNDQGVTWTDENAVSIPANPNFFEYNFATNGNIVSTSVAGASYSADNGLNWNAGTFPTSLTVSNKNSLTVSDAGTLLLLEWALKKVYTSTDHGVNWTAVTTTIPSTADRCAYYNNDLVCMCTDGSSIISTDNGASFTTLTAAGVLLAASGFGYELQETPSNIYTCGTNKIYRYGASTAAVPENGLENIAVLLYPNPASSSINVSTDKNQLNYKIFAPDGKLVLENTMHSTSETIATDKLPSGIYTLVAYVGSFVKTTHFIIQH